MRLVTPGSRVHWNTGTRLSAKTIPGEYGQESHDYSEEWLNQKAETKQENRAKPWACQSLVYACCLPRDEPSGNCGFYANFACSNIWALLTRRAHASMFIDRNILIPCNCERYILSRFAAFPKSVAKRMKFNEIDFTIIHSPLVPLLLTWFKFNHGMDT